MLARGYKAFYTGADPDEDSSRGPGRPRPGRRGCSVSAPAIATGRLAGFRPLSLPPHSWLGEVCYLQDLLTAEDARVQGNRRRPHPRPSRTAAPRPARGEILLATNHDNRPALRALRQGPRVKGLHSATMIRVADVPRRARHGRGNKEGGGGGGGVRGRSSIGALSIWPMVRPKGDARGPRPAGGRIRSGSARAVDDEAVAEQAAGRSGRRCARQVDEHRHHQQAFEQCS